MKILLRTEGIAGYDIFTEIDIAIPTNMIKLPILKPLTFKETMEYPFSTVNPQYIEFYRVGIADGMPYYKRKTVGIYD